MKREIISLLLASAFLILSYGTSCSPPPINLANIPPVRKISNEAAILLNNLPALSKEERTTSLNSILDVMTTGIEAETMKDRILKYLRVPEKQIDYFEFYLITGNGLITKGGDNKIYTGYIQNGVLVGINTVPDSLMWYILKCANGATVPTDVKKIEKKELIGRLEQITIRDTINFDYNKSIIDSSKTIEFKKLERVLRFIEENPEARLEIHGHTDTRGTSEYNIELSKKRAMFAFAYFEKHLDVKNHYIYTMYHGKRQPIHEDIIDNCINERIAAKNRRVELSANVWKII